VEGIMLFRTWERTTRAPSNRTATTYGIDVFVPTILEGAVLGFEFEEGEQLLGDSSDEERV
jgi:hypothetical protein